MSSHEHIDKVSSDNLAIGFDLLSNLTYMWVLSTGTLPRNRLMDQCGRQRLKTAIVFDYIHLLADRMGFEYARAFQLVSEKVKASNLKSLLLRFAASISSGESEREFIAQEAATEGIRYANEYDRSVENLRKWTDAYAAILISVTLIMVVSLVSTMMGSLGQNFIVLMAFSLFFITTTGVFVIYKVAPVEQTTYDAPRNLTRNRRMARLLLITMTPLGLALAFLLLQRLEHMDGVAVAFLVIGASLVPGGIYAWKDDASVLKLDSEIPTFLRSVGNVAGSTGTTLTQSLNALDTKSMGTLEPHIERLKVRLSAQLPTGECWESFRQETGSDLVNRSTHMLLDGAELGGPTDQVGQICSDFTLNVTQLRAKRALTASTFSFLTLPMHATMTFILVFVLQIVTNFSAKLSSVSSSGVDSAAQEIVVPDSLQMPPGMSVASRADLTGGLNIFGGQDLTLVTYTILVVIIILTAANALAPKFASGGSNLKIAAFLSVMCLTSGVVLGVVPFVTNKLFSLG